ncbi:MAG: gliding motility-associated C-terminal domain-containing protein [Flavobacteriales bacterium]|nr:gliding motility-associated C-terminal domain-containing protein [Flavobacteriales bacterium]
MRRYILSIVLILGGAISSIAQTTPTIVFFPPSGCVDADLTFTSSSFVADGIQDTEWDFDNNGTIDATGLTVTNPFTNSGPQSVRLTVTSNAGITNSTVATVLVYPNPSAAISIPTVGCLEANVAFTATDTLIFDYNDIATFSWDFGDGSPVLTGSSVSHTYTTVTTGVSPSLTMTSNEACITVETFTLSVNNGPLAAFTSNIACLGDSTYLTNTSTPGLSPLATSTWYFNDPLSDDNTSMEIGTGSVVHEYLNAGTYGDTLIVIDEVGCIDTVINTVTVEIPLQALAISGNTTLFDLESSLTSLSTTESFTSYAWYKSDSIYLGSSTILENVMDSGSYSVSVLDGSGCSLSTSIYITEISATLSAKNIITPNGDGKNEVWIIDDLASFTSCEVQIFNRWGKNVYSEDIYNNSWNGTFEGNPLPEGVYFYTVNCPTEEISGTGSITLLR